MYLVEVGVESISRNVVFSRWRKDGHYLRIDGDVQNRQDLIDKFNGENCIKLFLISTKAGNMGINLQVPFPLHLH